jgi:DNA polymerase-3 subunit gamma/tau
VREQEARAMLGTVDRQQVVQLVRLLSAGDMAGLLAYAKELEQWSPDYVALLDELNSLLARIALFQAAGQPYDDEEEVPAQTMAELAGALPPEDLQLFYQIGLTGRRDLPLITDQRSGFAMTLVRMLAFRPGAERSSASSGQRAASTASSAPPRAASAAMAAAGEANGSVAAQRSSAALPLTAQNWPAIIEQLGLTGVARQLAAHCALGGRDGMTLRLLLDPRSQSIRTAGNQEKLAAALVRYSGEPLRVQIELAEGAEPSTPARERDRQADERLASARAALEVDPNIQALRTQMGATIFADSVRPNHEEN